MANQHFKSFTLATAILSNYTKPCLAACVRLIRHLILILTKAEITLHLPLRSPGSARKPGALCAPSVISHRAPLRWQLHYFPKLGGGYFSTFSDSSPRPLHGIQWPNSEALDREAETQVPQASSLSTWSHVTLHKSFNPITWFHYL